MTSIYEDIVELIASLGMNIIVAIGFIIDYLDNRKEP
jgi:preprotein translocase subunit Sss1